MVVLQSTDTVGWFHAFTWVCHWWRFQLTVLSFANRLNRFVHNNIWHHYRLAHKAPMSRYLNGCYINIWLYYITLQTSVQIEGVSVVYWVVFGKDRLIFHRLHINFTFHRSWCAADAARWKNCAPRRYWCWRTHSRGYRPFPQVSNERSADSR